MCTGHPFCGFVLSFTPWSPRCLLFPIRTHAGTRAHTRTRARAHTHTRTPCLPLHPPHSPINKRTHTHQTATATHPSKHTTTTQTSSRPFTRCLTTALLPPPPHPPHRPPWPHCYPLKNLAVFQSFSANLFPLVNWHPFPMFLSLPPPTPPLPPPPSLSRSSRRNLRRGRRRRCWIKV
jgi:hypothetical protein